MSKPKVIRGSTFYGNPISDYGMQEGYLDYGTLAKSFDAVLNNEIISKTEFEFEPVQGYVWNDYDEYKEIFQYYIISDSGASILEYWCPDEIVFYCDELDMYLWGVTHFGTAWSYVLTDVKIEIDEKEN